MIPAIYAEAKLPSVNLKQYYNQYHGYSFEEKQEETIYATYTVIKPEEVKAKILDYLGVILAKCWINKEMLKQLANNPHECLRENGIILPQELMLRVEFARHSPNRPRIVLYECTENHKKPKRICCLQLSMTAGR
jgi:hypothetical protein